MSGKKMNYRQVAQKAAQSDDIPISRGDVICSMVVNGKMKHLYSMKRPEMTDEEYDKEVNRCKNLYPKIGKWVKRDPYDDVVIQDIDSSFASDDLDKPDNSDDLDRLAESHDSYDSDDNEFASSDDY
jgi:hypothetical protein